MGEFQQCDGCVFDAVDFFQFGGVRCQHGIQSAEAREQRLGERLNISSSNREREQQFEQRHVGQRAGYARQKSLAEPLPVAFRRTIWRDDVGSGCQNSCSDQTCVGER